MENPEHLLPSNPDQTVILVVEDEVIVRNVARIVLESEGYFVLTADNGEDALFISRRYPGIIHGMLSDVRMPKMDGLKLREMILAERPETKVLLMSGQFESPAKDIPFLFKPFGPALLKQRMRELLTSSVPEETGHNGCK